MWRRWAWPSRPRPWARFADGVFVGQHGSWNRNKPVGYRVVFVPFRDGRPAGDPVDVVSGFLNGEGNTRGRPVGVSVDPRGALIVADDLSNTVWRVTPDQAPFGARSAARRVPSRRGSASPATPPQRPGASFTTATKASSSRGISSARAGNSSAARLRLSRKRPSVV